MELRPTASGTLSFGLVAIPVQIFSAHDKSQAIRFHHVHKDCGARLKVRYYCPKDERLVESDEIQKGFEVAKDRYVLFTDEELDAAQLETGDLIEIREFVPLAAIDPLYFEKAYFLGPGKGGGSPFHLLSAAMERTGRVAVARYGARGKKYLVALRPLDGGLVLHQLRFADTLRTITDVPVGERPEPQEAELELAMRLIEARSSESFRPESYQDEARLKLWQTVERKIRSDEAIGIDAAPSKDQIVDLMDALKASLAAGENKATDSSATGPDAARQAS